MIDKLLEWAREDANIKALVMTGSRVKGTSDELSDYDIVVLAEEGHLYLQDDRWMPYIGKVWLFIPEKVKFQGKIFGTRLVLFEGGINVDFTFFPVKFLDRLVKAGAFREPYEVLLDKVGVTEHLKAVSFLEQKIKKPSEKSYLQLVREFWFEAYQMAKSLKREDLWVVKSRDADVKHRLLLKMIEWYEEAKHHGADRRIGPIGKRMKTWVTSATWEAAHGIFAHFDKKDSWEGLANTLTLFRNLAVEVARMLNYHYPYEMDRNITDYIYRLKNDL